MRIPVLLCLAACGRLGFDAETGSPPDAPVDTPAADCAALAEGTPCDDRNICTASSSCQAGACTATQVVAGCQVADSMAEFDSTQGLDGWFYGFWLVGGSPYNPNTDFELAVYDVPSDGWNPVDPMGSQFIYLRSWGVHPQFDPVPRMPVRRWVSDVQGPAVVIVSVNKADTSCGDGVIAQLMVDGVEKMMKAISFDDPDGVTVPVNVELTVGTKVDALLSAGQTESCDTTEYSFIVASPE